MMKKLAIITLMITTAAIFGGCYYDKANQVYPEPANCDTTAVTYTEVKAILSANCYSCHSGTASFSGGRKLDTYDGVKTFVTNGKLPLAITHSPGATPMPYNQGKLPACTINKILGWINDGALNN